MLIVHRSNRIEWLAALLAERLRADPPSPWLGLEVMVNTWPTSRWLGERLALGLGTSAHIRFPFPGGHLRRLVNRLLGEDPAGEDPWRAGSLVWPILEELGPLLRDPAAAPLARWVARRQGEPAGGGRPAGAEAVDRALWALARSMADALDDYSLYRVDEMAGWLAGGDHDGPGRGPSSWQARLARRLAARLPREPFGLRVRRAIEGLRHGSCPGPGPDQPLRLFGISSLAPVLIELLQALSGRHTVEIYLLTPGPDLWQRCRERRRELKDRIGTGSGPEDPWLLELPPLESRFGRLGAEFQQLLEGTGSAQLGESRSDEVYHLPLGEPAASAPTLLAQLQHQLVRPGDVAALQRQPGDRSLEFHACPGRMRQVQIVRDRILQLLADDPALEPRHILVMTPQVDRFAPLLGSVLADRGATGVALPWRVTDRSLESEPGAGRVLAELLQLADERLTATRLRDLLDHRCLLEAFELGRDAGARLVLRLQEAGFRWGLDGEERRGDPGHSLAWAVERLLLGLALPAGDAAPCPDGGDVEELGRGLALLLALLDVLRRFRRPRPARDWATLLASVTERLFGGTAEREWERSELLRAVATWGARGRACDLPLEAAVVAGGLEEELAADSGRFGHRSGALTISALEPMRAIPHRVIVLMGLDAACFPRHRPRPGFHLMEQQRRLGDPASTDQDRYVLLEALMSARQHLLITWTSRDERSGEALPPALPVQQWLDQLSHELRRNGSGGEGVTGLLHDHPPNPLDRANFLPHADGPPASCDQRLLRARVLLDGGDAARPAAPLGRQPCPEHGTDEMGPWEDLLRWLIAPQRHWLARRGLRPREWLEPLQDEDPLEVDRRTGRRLLEEALERCDRSGGEADPPDWPRRLRSLGQLPRGAAAELAVADLDRRWRTLQRQLQPLGPPELRMGGHGSLRMTNRWHGRSLVMVSDRGSHGARRLELWARLLLAVVGGETPERALLIAPAGRDGSFERAEELRPPGPDAARALLEELLALRESCREQCWPVPPRTGWAWASGEDPGRRLQAATRVWAGSAGGDPWPERESPEMVLCFGERLPAEALLGERFEQACRALYGPLLAQRGSP